MTESAASNNHKPTGRVILGLAQQGFFFSPTSAGMTRSDRTGWHDIATSDWDTIKQWVSEGSSLVSVAKRGHGFAIDIDDLAAVEAKGFQLSWLDGYLLVDTPSGGLHAHGLHDAKTSELGSSLVLVYAIKGDKKSDKIFELKLHNASVAAPTAWRVNQPKKKDGRYEPREDIKDIKHGLCPGLMEWLSEHAEAQTKTVAGPKNWEFHEDWVLDDFLASNHCAEARQYWTDSTLWVVPDKCPLCDKPVGSSTDLATRTKFSFGGRGWGFVCHACGINTRGEFDERMKELYSGWKPWKQKIYCKRDEDEDYDSWEVEDAVDEGAPVEEVKTVEASPQVSQADWAILKQTYTEEELAGLGPRALRTMLPAASTAETEDDIEQESEESDEKLEKTKIIGERTNTEGNTSFGVMAQRASEYSMTELQWLWPQRVPLGKVTLFTGMPDCAKSLCLIDLCTRISTGKNFPDGERNSLGASEVLFAATEDDPQDTIVPRLCAAGADLTKILIVRGIMKTKTTAKGKKQRSKNAERLNLKRDVELVLDSLKANPQIKLLALDPITSFFGDADSNKDADVRPMLERFQKVLNLSGVTCVGIIHSNKRSDVDAIGKVSGAGAIAAVVRATWGFSRDKEDKSLYHMAFVKGNLGKVKTGLDYTIGEAAVEIQGKPTIHPRIVWGEANDKDANDLLDEARQRKDEKDTKLIKAQTLIQTMIPAKLKDIYAKGEKEGISEQTVKNAKRKIIGLIHKQFNKEWWAYTAEGLPFWAKPEDQTMDDMPE